MTEMHSYVFNVFDSLCRIKFYVQDDATSERYFLLAQQELERIEKKYSRENKFSVINSINASSGTGRSVRVDHETRYLLDYAERIYQQSSGLFDITTSVLRDLWSGKDGVEPSKNALEGTLIKLTGWNVIGWGGGEIMLPERGMKIDFNAFLKEYAADNVVKLLVSKGVVSVFVDVDGAIAVSGPQLNNDPWYVDVASPYDSQNVITQLPISSGGLAGNVGSGPSENQGSVEFSQLFCPKTGLPVLCESIVKVQAERCLVAGVINSVAMLQGEHVGINWLSSLGVPFIVYSPEDHGYARQKIA